MKLYEIKQEYQQLVNDVMSYAEDNNGEITKEMDKRLAETGEQLEAKVQACVCAWKNLNAEADAIEAEVKRLQDRAKRKRKNADSLKEYVRFNIPAGKKYSFPEGEIAWRKSTSCEIVDLNLVPPEYVSEKTVYSADKKAIKEALKDGAEIKGAQLIQKNNLSIKRGGK